MTFVEEFRKNIPYITDAVYWDITDQRLTTDKLEDIIQDSLTDWLNDYQTEEAQSLFDKENEFPQEDFEL
jgi:hypothetical protein